MKGPIFCMPVMREAGWPAVPLPCDLARVQEPIAADECEALRLQVLHRRERRAQAVRRLCNDISAVRGVARIEGMEISQPFVDPAVIPEVPERHFGVTFRMAWGAPAQIIRAGSPVTPFSDTAVLHTNDRAGVDHGTEPREDRWTVTDYDDHATAATFAEAFGLRHTSVHSVTISVLLASPVFASGFFCGLRRKASAQ